MIIPSTSNILLLTLLSLSSSRSLSSVDDDRSRNQSGKKIAIIGGGIGGTFSAKYLSDYDDECSLDSITIYEPYSILTNGDEDSSDNTVGDTQQETITNVIPYPIFANNNISQQGPRVSSIQLSDGTIVELGASIIFSGNKLALEMLENDNTLMKIKPLSSEVHSSDDSNMNNGMGVFNGFQESNGANGMNVVWPLCTSNMSKKESERSLIWRYNLDLYKVNKATEQALQSFETIYDILRSNHLSSFQFASPNDLWREVGLDYAASVSLDTFLDSIGVSSHLSWWRRWFLSDQGSFRDELFSAMNICNNNKDNSQMTGLAGLVNFVASKGDLFAIKGGNHRLVQSAFKQAKKNYHRKCSKSDGAMQGDEKVSHVPKRVKTVVSDFETKGIELFDTNGKKLGKYDLVIVATPLQFSDISFLTKGSLFDSHVLHPMTLNGIVDSENSNANDHEHKAAIGGGLPDSAIRAYTQVVTTIVSNAKLNKSYFLIEEESSAPKSILFTVKGKEETGISSIGQIAPDIFKIFSSSSLPEEKLFSIFGADVKIEYVKVWGDKNGGATPDFNGGDSSLSTQFLLYDGGNGVSGLDDEGSALYYINSIESAVSAIEISAIGALAVSKLIARRLELLQPVDNVREEEL